MDGFYLIFRQGPYRDETSSYTVDFSHVYTVREFVNEVLMKKEWGYVGIANAQSHSFFGDPYFEYRNDTIIKHDHKWKTELLDRTIKSATAEGGWGRMDYLLTLE